MTNSQLRISNIIWLSVFYSSSLVLVFAALLVLCGTLLHSDARVYRFVLLPDTALALVAAVLLLWAVISKKPALVLAAMLVVALVAGAGLLWYQADVGSAALSWQSDEARLPPLQSTVLLLFCFVWSGWFLRPTSHWCRVFKGLRLLFNLLLAGLSFCMLLAEHGFLSGTSLSLDIVPGSDAMLSLSATASVHTALYLLLLAAASFTAPYVKTRPSAQQLRSSGWLLVCFIALASALLWFNFAHQLQQKAEQVSAQIADKLQLNVNQMIAEQRGLMYRLAERINAAEYELSQSYFSAEIHSYLRDYPYIDYLAVQAGDGSLLYANAQQNTELAWFNRYLQQLPDIQPQHFAGLSQPSLRLYYDTVIDHAFVLAAIAPVNRAGVAQVVASVDFAKALRLALPELIPEGYFVKLQQTAQNPVYNSVATAPDATKVGQFAIDLMPGFSWQLRVYTNLNADAKTMLLTAEVVLLAGWLTTLLVMLSQKYYQQSQRHRMRLLAGNDKLQHSLDTVRLLQLKQQQILENSADLICVIDADGCFVELSKSCGKILGYRPDELLQQNFIDFVHPQDKVLSLTEADKITSGTPTNHFRNRYLRKDGSVVHLMWAASYVDVYRTIYAVARDISYLVKAELYQQAQQDVLRMISTEQALPEILQRICLMAEQQSSTVLAAVMLKQGEQLHLAAAPSFSTAFAGALTTLAVADNAGCCGAAAYQKSLVMSPLISADEKCRIYAAAAQEQGVLACWSMPMVSLQDDVVGTFALYCTEQRIAGKEELELMISCSRFAALAIERAAHTRLLQQSEQRFRSLYELNPDPVYILNPEGYFVDMNQAGCKLLQYSRAEVIAMHYGRVMLPEHLPLVHRHFASVLAGNGERFEASIVTRNGRQLELDISIIPSWQDGKIIGVIGISKNISERVLAQNQLRLFKRAVDATSNGVIIADVLQPDMPIIYVNSAFEKLTGYSSTEVVGRNCRFLQGKERDLLATNQIRDAIAKRQEYSVVLRNFRKDNRAFWNNLFLAPVPDDCGAITHYIGIQADITEQKNYEQELAYNSSHDLLTGLPNRALLKDRLTQSYQISKRNQQKVAILFIDLDGFKLINDSLGHLNGDEVLKQSSMRIVSCIRPGDTLARIGGDEFVLMLTDLSSADEVMPVTERILAVVAQPLNIAGQELHITASIGISLSDNEQSEPMQMVQQADLAMYRAKQLGRNNYQWYSAELDVALSKQLNLRAQLKKAISNQEFELYYQPQIDAISGDIIGLEALLRWPDKQAGFISPDEFIPLAEETGEIVPLSNWVLDHASRYNKSLIERGIASVVMAVNISSIQFQRSNFVEQLQQTLQTNGLAPRWFEIELTESVLFDNTEQVILKLQQLRQIGVKISIDDFGTGYSSLNYLKRLPMDKLKIDRTFIRDIVTDKRDAAISRAIIAMAHHLDIRVIAEGVENEAQVALLRKSLCDEYQGYYFAKPMPAAQLELFIQQYPTQRQILPESVSNQQTILLVDDEENILSALTRVLRRDAYRVLTCTGAKQAFDILALNQVQVILSDQRMPGISGTEFFSQVKDMYPDTIRIVLSGYTDLRSVTEAINKGAIYKFMTKPWQDDELRSEIKQAFAQYQQQINSKTGQQ
ncbi:PAS domain S-box-containing protein/diguanylate cyclase (GGDEF) domain-containing protein [Rheinheimera pacifica]|uniref:cyclic-guanylate-specific phosphodiesterase n=1 Tax=Rheinheimera pacifica TaxID=173990 RepID=A0A1H6KT42_9GAMM|nr:PAS domain S-box-containing protein/diguanylate cyclase (GGDEF) domain-containing protein [Rheinheimera pacifica]